MAYSWDIFQPHFDTVQIDIPMLARFPLHAPLPTARPNDRVMMRLADWWPAALIGLLALMGGIPDGNAQTLLSLL